MNSAVENRRANYGDPVIDGKLRYVSPTGIQQFQACNRKWWYRTVLDLPEERRSFSELGTKCHAEIEHYLKTGENVLGPITSAARKHTQFPSTNQLLIEHDIGGGSLDKTRLRVDDIAVIGVSDLINLHPNGYSLEYGCFTAEVLDWKFGAALKGSENDYSKKAHELPEDVQMVTYANWLLLEYPHLQQVLLSHVYTNTKGRPESTKSSILVPRKAIEKRWQQITPVIRCMSSVAKIKDEEKIVGNRQACDSFGGCSFRDRCNVYKFNSLESFFGSTGSDLLLKSIGATKMGLLDSLNMPPSSGGLDVLSQIASLSKASPAAAPAFTPEFANAVTLILSKGWGFPALGGAAAKAYSALLLSRGVAGIDPNAAGYAGSGQLGLAPEFAQGVSDPNDLVKIAEQLAALPSNPNPTPPPSPVPSQPMGLLPPDVPQSKPELAAVPLVTSQVQVPGLIESVPPATAAPILASAAVQTETPSTEGPKKRGRKPGSKNAPKDQKDQNANTEPANQDRWLFIDCVPSVPFEHLQPTVDEWTVGIATQYNLSPVDLRVAPKDSPFAYGGWHGAIAAFSRAKAAELPPGTYYLDSRASGFNDDVVEGLRTAQSDNEPVFDLIVRANR